MRKRTTVIYFKLNIGGKKGNLRGTTRAYFNLDDERKKGNLRGRGITVIYFKLNR